MNIGLSIVLSGIINGGAVVFSEALSLIVIGGLIIGGKGRPLASIRVRGTPVSCPNGIWSLVVPDALLLTGGPASNGVRNAFSHEPTPGSAADTEGVGILVITGGGG